MIFPPLSLTISMISWGMIGLQLGGISGPSWHGRPNQPRPCSRSSVDRKAAAQQRPVAHVSWQNTCVYGHLEFEHLSRNGFQLHKRYIYICIYIYSLQFMRIQWEIGSSVDMFWALPGDGASNRMCISMSKWVMSTSEPISGGSPQIVIMNLIP